MTGRAPWTVLGLIAVLAVALLACSKKKEPLILGPNPKSASGRHYKATVENVRECAIEKSPFVNIQPGNVALGVEVTVEAPTAYSVNLGYSEIRLIDAEGHSFKALTLGGCKPELNGNAQIQAGTHVRGWLTFEVPAKPNGLTLSLRTMVLNHPPSESLWDEYVKFELR